MVKKNKSVRTTKAKSTSEKLLASLSSKERREFEKEHKDLLISELLLAVMEQDDISVRKLAQLAEVSPTVVQAMRSGVKKDFSMQSFFKILKGLGFKKMMIERNGQSYPLDITHLKRL